jgi:ApaG protein
MSRWAIQSADTWISSSSPKPHAPSPYNQSVSDTTTNGIRVQVTTKYLPERSSPRDNEYWFAYFIRISNVGSETAQLISRHWVITNTDGEEEEVRGEGVVGEQPVLSPGTIYNYNSFCNLKTSVGTMHGEYIMVTPSGETFEARIAPFTLAVPNALN